MASTLETRDHFKDVSSDDVCQTQQFTQDQSRQNRLPSLDNASSMTFGSSFGVGKSMWNSTSSIWRSTNKYMDGASDEDTQNHGQNNTLTSSKSGSKSLLSSSQSEAPPTRKNVPWATSVNTNAFNSRSQNQPMSPLRQRNPDSLATSQRTAQNSGLTTHTVSPTHGDFQSFQAVATQASNGSRHPLDMNTLADYLPSLDGGQSMSNQNFAANQVNGAFEPTPTSRMFQDRPHELRGNFGSYHSADKSTVVEGTPVNGLFRPFNMSYDVEAFSPSHKVEPYRHSTKGNLENGSPAVQLQHPSLDQQYDLQPAYQRQSMTNVRFSAPTSARSESFQNNGNQYFPSYSRTNSFGDPTTASPTASEYKHSFNKPYHSNSGTPPTGSDFVRTTSNSGISTRVSQGYGQLFDRGHKESSPFREYPSFQLNPLQSTIGYSNGHDLSGYPGTMRMNPLASPYTMPGYLSMSGLPAAPRFQIRETEYPQVARSPLLEDFRMNNKNNKRYELRDIYNHIVEFSGDQHGSRFIQQKLETANSDEKDQIFTEIQPNSLQLMTDVFGNYVIQKLFEHGNQSQKKLLANQMKGHVLSLSTQMYGCRVVQKALEHVLIDQQASIVKELENHVLKCVKDQNGNHVIQKAIERVPAEHIQFIMNAFTDQVQRLATHPYGCRVIQRMLEHCEESARKSILQELHACVPRLITDQFGNYVIQHVIENGEPEDKHSIVVIVLSQLLVFSKHKFASNVVEKSIEFAQEDQRSDILKRLTGQDANGESPVLGLMRDQYGNYVIQKILGQLKGQEREALVNQIKSQLVQLKRFSYGKQIIAIEKLIFDDQQTSSLSTSSQSSTLPSTNASTVEGPIASPYHHDTNKLHGTQIALPLTMSSIRT